MDKLFEESFVKIYYMARFEESKSSLMMAVNEFNTMKKEAGADAAKSLQITKSFNGFIQNFECNLTYLIGLLMDEPILGEGDTRDIYISGMLKAAAQTFKDNDIKGTNILGDPIPDSFNIDYFKTHIKDIHNAYVKIGKHPTVRAV